MTEKKQAFLKALKAYIAAHPDKFEEDLDDEDLADIINDIDTSTIPDFDDVFGRKEKK